MWIVGVEADDDPTFRLGSRIKEVRTVHGRDGDNRFFVNGEQKGELFVLHGGDDVVLIDGTAIELLKELGLLQ